MTVRGRILATVGVGTRWMEPDVTPTPPLDIDGFFCNATALAPVLADLPAVDAPPDFVRLDLVTVLAIVRDMQTKRLPMDPTESVSLAYLPDGRFIVGAEGIDTYGYPTGHTLDRGRLCIVQCEALRSPIGAGAQYQPHTRQDRIDACRRDAVAVAAWHAHPDGRTWEAGAPLPPPVLEDGPLEMLSAKARRTIARAVRNAVDTMPAVALADRPTLCFDPDGRYYGLGIIPSFDKPPSHYLTCRIGPTTDPGADVDDWLDRVRVRASGVVELVG